MTEHSSQDFDREAEVRVRAFLTAQAEEDGRTLIPTPELAWAVPDEGGMVTLHTADLRRLVDALETVRPLAVKGGDR